MDRMDATAQETPRPSLQQDAVKSAVMAHIHTPVKKWYQARKWIAAAVLLPACLSIVWWQQQVRHSRTPAIAWLKSSTGKQEIKQVQLPDGTIAWLNAASTLEYPASFDTRERLVKIQGQVFFDVQQNKEQPFTVQSGDFRVQVLGTAFLVRHIAGQPTRVAVASGKVQVSHKAAVLATLLPADQLTCTGNRTIISKTDTSALSAWTKGDMVISNATLQQVLWELENFYGITFHSDFNMDQGHLNLSFNSNMSLQDKLDIISTISITPKVRFRKKGNSIYEVYQ
nr:FecR domain-containing protein [Chitinophaga nivalis]